MKELIIAIKGVSSVMDYMKELRKPFLESETYGTNYEEEYKSSDRIEIVKETTDPEDIRKLIIEFKKYENSGQREIVSYWESARILYYYRDWMDRKMKWFSGRGYSPLEDEWFDSRGWPEEEIEEIFYYGGRSIGIYLNLLKGYAIQYCDHFFESCIFGDDDTYIKIKL